MSANGQTGLTVYPLAHYKFGKKVIKSFPSRGEWRAD